MLREEIAIRGEIEDGTTNAGRDVWELRSKLACKRFENKSHKISDNNYLWKEYHGVDVQLCIHRATEQWIWEPDYLQITFIN